MKKSLIFVLAALIIVIFTLTASFSEETAKTPIKDNKLSECIKNISKLQSLIEYFYLQSGIYPDSLESLDKSYNIPPDKSTEIKEKIEIPKDPATGKSFVYKFDEKTPDKYFLTIPDPKAYGVERIELNAIDWGWMKTYAGEERRKWGISICIDLLKRLATDIEIYASENKKQFPKTLDDLIKAKFDVPEVLTCPVCKKKYVYELNKDNSYVIKCAEPSAHKVKQLEYDSLKGIVGK